MRDITSRLRHKVDVYRMIPGKDALGAHTTRPEKLKVAFCEIVPQRSKIKDGEANTERNLHAFRFLFRRKSLPGIEKDWFFMHQNKKYEIDYFNLDFKENTFLEVFCTRVEE